VLLQQIRAHPQRVETSIKGLEGCLGLDVRSDAGSTAVFDIDGRPYRDLVAFAIGLQRVKGRRFH